MSGCSVSLSVARLVRPKRGDLKGEVRGPRVQAGLWETAPAGRASGSTSRTGWRAEGEDPLGRQRWVKAGGLGEEPLSRPWPRLCAIFIGNSQVKLLLKGADGLGSVWWVPQGFAGRRWVQGGHEAQEGSSAPRSSSGPAGRSEHVSGMPRGAGCGLSARADLPLPLTNQANGPGDLRLGLPSAGFWTVNNNSASLLLRTYRVSVF